MKFKKEELKIEEYEYKEDVFFEKRLQNKKGNKYWKSNPEWVQYFQYRCSILGSLNLLDDLQNAQKKKDTNKETDIICSIKLIDAAWDILEENELTKVINKAKSKKEYLSVAIDELVRSKGYNWIVDGQLKTYLFP